MCRLTDLAEPASYPDEGNAGKRSSLDTKSSGYSEKLRLPGLGNSSLAILILTFMDTSVSRTACEDPAFDELTESLSFSQSNRSVIASEKKSNFASSL